MKRYIVGLFCLVVFLQISGMAWGQNKNKIKTNQVQQSSVNRDEMVDTIIANQILLLRDFKYQERAVKRAIRAYPLIKNKTYRESKSEDKQALEKYVKLYEEYYSIIDASMKGLLSKQKSAVVIAAECKQSIVSSDYWSHKEGMVIRYCFLEGQLQEFIDLINKYLSQKTLKTDVFRDRFIESAEDFLKH